GIVSGNDQLVATLNFTAMASGSANVAFSLNPPRESTIEDANFQPLPFSIAGTSAAVRPATTAAFSLNPAFITAETGSRFEVDVLLFPKNQTVSIADVHLDFDPSRISFVGGTINESVFGVGLYTSNFLETTPG